MVTFRTLRRASPFALSIKKSTATGRLPVCVDADKRKLPRAAEFAGGVETVGVDGVGVEVPLTEIKKI